tara:strand:- start:4664 stop:5257 length:594 start_codon:yes stop_codon:yes gene_type:complete
MNYIIEDGINFYDELNNIDSDNSGDICMLSGEIFGQNSIELSCGHKFNYLPLYNEIIEQKFVSGNKNILRVNEFICPYCRSKHKYLLPYIPNTKKIHGINIPTKYVMSYKKCSWVLKNGKKKNCLCNNNGFESSFGNICEKHYNIENKKMNISSKWNKKMEEYSKKYSSSEIREELKKKRLKISGTKKEMIIRLLQN